MYISSANYITNFGASSSHNSDKIIKSKKNTLRKHENNVISNNSIINDSFVHGIKMNNFENELTNFIRLHDINKKSLKVYKQCVSAAKKDDPRVYALLCKYTPSIEETGFKISHNPYSNFNKYVNQIIALIDSEASLRGTFEVLYDLSGNLIDTEIDLQDLN